MSDLPNIPALSSKVDPEVKKAFTTLKTWFDRTGLVSVSDLAATGLFSQRGDGSLVPNAPFLDTAIPPRLTGVQAVGAFNSIMLTWDDPRYARLAHVEVFRATVDNLGEAVRVGTTQSTMYADTPPRSSLSVTYYYWVRIVSQASIHGPFNATAGTLGKTADDPEYLLEVLTGEIREGQLYTTLGNRINLIDAPGSGLVDSVSDLANNQLSSLDQYNTQYLRVLDHENKLNAIVTVDPNTGQIQLLAEANVTTDVEARLTTVEFDLNSAEGTIASNVSRLNAVDGDISSMNSSITQLGNSVALKADTAYVDSAVIGMGDSMSPEQQNVMDGLGPEAILRMVLLGDKMNRESLLHKSNIARAQFDIESNADAISAEAQARLLLATQVGTDIAAAVLVEQQARSTAISAEAEARALLAVQVDANAAAITQEQTTRANADTAEAQARAQLAATVSSNTAAIAAEQVTRANADSALSQSVQTIQTTVDGQTAAVQEVSNSVNGIMAEKTIKVDANNVIASIGLRSDPNGSEVGVYAGRFFIADPAGGAGTVLPFIVSGGKVYIDTALIANAAIKNAMVEALSADKLTVPGTGTIWEAIINLGKITSAYIGDFIQSDNYFPGQSGWHINKDGSAELRNIFARGDIEASSLKVDSANVVKTLHIEGEAVTVPMYSEYSGADIQHTGGGVWYDTGVQVTITQQAGLTYPVLLNGTGWGLVTSYLKTCHIKMRITRVGGGSSMEGYLGAGVDLGSGGWVILRRTGACTWKDTPGAGTWTYKLQVYCEPPIGSGGTWIVNNLAMSLLSCKR